MPTHPWTRIGGPPEHTAWFADPTIPIYHPEVDPSAVVQPFVTVDSGIERPTKVGARTLLLAHVHVGHDALVGEDCVIATGTVVGGHAEIADGVKVGVNATILPFRKVGRNAVVGAGAVVTRDVEPGSTVAGNPARVLEDSERDLRPHTERATLEYVRCSGFGFEGPPCNSCPNDETCPITVGYVTMRPGYDANKPYGGFPERALETRRYGSLGDDAVRDEWERLVG